MAGLAGVVWASPGEQDWPAAAMGRRMAHRDGDAVRIVRERHCVLLSVDRPDAPLTGTARSLDGHRLFMVQGTVYSDAGAESGAALARRLLEDFERDGLSALTGLNGEYLVIIWDARAQAVTLVTDRLGLRPLHWWSDGQVFAWASELKALLALPAVRTSIDEQALTELLTFGYCLDLRTLLEDVSLMPAGSVMTWQGGIRAVEKYWQYRFQPDAGLEDEVLAADALECALEQAIARRIRGAASADVSLTGGLDSRSIAGLIRRLAPDLPIRTWTYGHDHAQDVRFAARIARAIGSRHTFLELSDRFVTDVYARGVWLTDGTVAASFHPLRLIDALEGQRVVRVFNGYLGGCWGRERVLPSSLDALTGIEYERAVRGCTLDQLRLVLPPAAFRRNAHLPREVIRRTLSEAAAEDPISRALWAEHVQRQRRLIAHHLRLLELAGRVATPFADADVVDVRLRLPVRMGMDDRVYQAMSRRTLPRLARIPRTGRGLPPGATASRTRLNWHATRFTQTLLPRLSGGRLGGHRYEHYLHLTEWFRNAGRPVLERHLLHNPGLGDVLNAEGVHRLVGDFLAGRTGSSRDAYQPIAALLTVACFLKTVVRGEGVPVSRAVVVEEPSAAGLAAGSGS
jgi:asparagine synthetase B (glutamine-hydrolysing)